MYYLRDVNHPKLVVPVRACASSFRTPAKEIGSVLKCSLKLGQIADAGILAKRRNAVEMNFVLRLEYFVLLVVLGIFLVGLASQPTITTRKTSVSGRVTDQSNLPLQMPKSNQKYDLASPVVKTNGEGVYALPSLNQAITSRP
jgi:hypothetical protein